MKTCSVKLCFDSSQLIPALKGAQEKISTLSPEQKELTSKAFELLLDSGDCLFEVGGVELNNGATGASELLVPVNPTDRFVSFLSAIPTGDAQ